MKDFDAMTITYQIAGVALIGGAIFTAIDGAKTLSRNSSSQEVQMMDYRDGAIGILFAAAMLAGASCIFKADPLIKL
jgi:hypothetical protein